MDIVFGLFVWNALKEQENAAKHGVHFIAASKAFEDPNIKIFVDSKHSEQEERFFAIGKVEEGILTVRFTYRGGEIRILGAGYWRNGRRLYERKKGP